MPLYDYICEACGLSSEEYESIHAEPQTVCPVCGEAQFHRVPSVGRPPQEYHRPIEMNSVALSSKEEVRAFQQRNPGVDCSDDPRDPLFGVPIARTRQQKLSILKNEGFVEAN